MISAAVVLALFAGVVNELTGILGAYAIVAGTVMPMICPHDGLGDKKPARRP
jgi:hypothetical protein